MPDPRIVPLADPNTHNWLFLDRDTVTEQFVSNNKNILQMLHIPRPHPFHNFDLRPSPSPVPEPDDNDPAVPDPTRDMDEDEDDDAATVFISVVP